MSKTEENSKQNMSKGKMIGLNLGLLGIIIHVVGLWIAMPFYPGGTPKDPTTVGYSFWDNFFSDMGMVNAWNGAANGTAMILFNIMFVVFGIALIIIPLAVIQGISEKKPRQLAVIAGIFNILGGIFCILIVFFPYDVASTMHNMAMLLTFACLMVAFLIYGIGALKNLPFNRQTAVCFLIAGVIILVYLILQFNEPYQPDRILRNRFAASSQKIVVYAVELFYAMAILGAKRNK